MSYQVQYVYDLVNKVSGKLHDISKDFQKHSKNINKSLNRASQSMHKHGQEIRNMGLKYTAFISAPIALFGKSMLKVASDSEEISSKFSTVYAEILKGANNTAQTLAKSYGLSIIKSKELLANTGDLLSGFGFTGKSALQLSHGVQKLAVDLASFTNYAGGAEGASQAITKALLGEREQIKMLGIAILEEDVKRRMAIMRAKGMRFETLKQAKAYATLKLAQEQSKNAIGDYARTSESFANRSRVLSQRLLDLKVSFGNLVLPQATKFIDKITNMVEKFTALSPKTKKVILALAGIGLVLPPIIMTIGLLALGISGLMSPIGIIIGGFVTLVGIGAILYAKFEPFALLVNKIFDIIFKIAKFTVGGGFVEFGAKLLGFDIDNIGRTVNFDIDSIRRNVQNTVVMPQTREIFTKQEVNMGGELNINVNGLPTGSSLQYTPANNSKLQTRINSIFAN